MRIRAKYRHTNLVARDWKKLAAFYETVFGCVPVPPERDYSAKTIEQCTGIPGAKVRGMHLRLPGYGETGPTLEIFEYDPIAECAPVPANFRGFAHIAFEVDDVDAARRIVLDAGGSELGDVLEMDVPNAGRIRLVYLRDPEGNIVELQKWS